MNKHSPLILLAAATLLAPSAFAQSSSTSTATGATARPSTGPAGSATGGAGGSAAIGGTSATSLGIGGTSTANGTKSSALGTGASAAAVDGKTKTQAGVHGNNVLNSRSRAQAMDAGTFSRSTTKCQVKDDVACRTRTMTHEPGSKPTVTTSTTGR